jgi:ADP-ribosyl-[dinitrogen reductase] hydrolase
VAFFNRYIQQQANALKGGLYGLILGDAVGRLFEFKAQDRLPAFHEIDIVPPQHYTPTYPYVPIGTWTDDSAQALALLDSLIQQDGLNLNDFSTKLLDWLYEGKYTPDGVVFDCGIQTRYALNNIRHGANVEQAAQNDEYANGNGALMRTLPIALWHYGDDAQLVRLAIRQGIPTHGHIRSGVVCALYCLMARQVIDDTNASLDFLDDNLVDYLNETEQTELEHILNAPQREKPQGSGYVVDTFWGAIQSCTSHNNFADVVRAAILLGNDTDTTASVAGGLAGLKYGYDQLPTEWLSHLKGTVLVEELFAPLERRIIEKIKYEIDLLLERKSFAAQCLAGHLSHEEMEKGFTVIKDITVKRTFWFNYDYLEFPSNQEFDSVEKISTMTKLEEITAYVTFTNRADHCCTCWDNDFPSTAWYGVIMSGVFDAILDKLVEEFNKLKNGL